MSIISNDPYMITGKSGISYSFSICSLDSEFPNKPGVYIFAKYRKVNNSIYVYEAIYCGKAGDLKGRIQTHITNKDIINSPKCVCVFIATSKQKAIDYETDILEGNEFVQNIQHQGCQ